MLLNDIINYIISLIRTSGPWGVVAGVMIESLLAPIPSPLIIMAAGFIMLPPNVPISSIIVPLILTITIPGALATTLGSYIGYGIGYFGGKPLIKKMEWFLGVSWEELNKGMRYFQKGYSDEIIIFFARAIPIVPLSIFSATAGVLRVDAKTFTLCTFLGSLLRVFLLGLFGWLMGSAYESYAMKLDKLENIGIVLILGIVIYVLFSIYKRKKEHKQYK